MKLLAAIEFVLKTEERPMSSREIAFLVKNETHHLQSGKTPWKTTNARLSEDILKKGEMSKFLRTDQGKFGLREWDNVHEFHSPRRKLSPIDEVIKVVKAKNFEVYKNKNIIPSIYDVDIRSLLLGSEEMVRRDAEESTEFIQLIPTFLVRQKNEILGYNRTKRLPEARLHNNRSINKLYRACRSHWR